MYPDGDKVRCGGARLRRAAAAPCSPPPARAQIWYNLREKQVEVVLWPGECDDAPEHPDGAEEQLGEVPEPESTSATAAGDGSVARIMAALSATIGGYHTLD